MENTTYIALSRQMALWRQMQVVANNMANMNTTAYKREDVVFDDYLVEAATGGGRKQELAFVQDVGLVRDVRPGPLERTDNPLDVALHGDGYFVVETPQGMRYTRNGRFTLDQTGMLLASGHPVMQDNELPVVFAPNETQIEISRDGTIATENGVIGRLKVVQFENEQMLRKAGNNLYTTDALPIDVERPDVVQGMLERSNIEPVLEVTQMIELQRSYEATMKMLDNEHERRGKAMDVLSGASGS